MKKVHEAAIDFAKKICKDMGVYGQRDYMCTSGVSDYEAFTHGVEFAQQWNSAEKEKPECPDFGVSDNVILRLHVMGTKRKNEYECCIEGYYDSDTDDWRFMLPLNDKNLKITVMAWRPVHHN